MSSCSSINGSMCDKKDGSDPQKSTTTTTTSRKRTSSTIRIAFVGNSILYFNDCPRLVQQMLEASGDYDAVIQNSCLHGGMTLRGLWEKGNGMTTKFATPPAAADKTSSTSTTSAMTTTTTITEYDIGACSVQELLRQEDWDYVIMNDQTQYPAREETKQVSLGVLRDSYAPAFGNAVPVFLQTAAYRVPNIRGTEDLGPTVRDFTDRIYQGYKDYVRALLQESLLPHSDARMATSGNAYLRVHDDDRELWKALFSWDDFHPSPAGTWLQACCIYGTVTGREPPAYDEKWWKKSRYMQPPDQKPLPLPTAEQAETLRRVAWECCRRRDGEGGAEAKLAPKDWTRIRV